MNLIITEGNQDFSLEPLEQRFLFPYLFRFALIVGLSAIEGPAVVIEEKDRELLVVHLSEALRALLQDGYEPPLPRQRQKHPSYFEKFLFDNQKYVVNYTTSPPGRLMFLIALRLRLIEAGGRVVLKPMGPL